MTDGRDTFEDGDAGDLSLSIRGVSVRAIDDPNTLALGLQTSRGTIAGLVHPVEGGTGAVICVGGASGGLDGPAGGLYGRLPAMLAPAGVTVVRIDYRAPNILDECVADVLAACSFLRGVGATDAVLLGHSFGGAVVIRAGELSPMVRGVASMSPQRHGTLEVDELLAPLLLLHGTADTVLSSEASEDIYRRAQLPKRIVLFADTGHSLIEARDDIDALLASWIPDRLAGLPDEPGRQEIVPRPRAN